jgi:hypothetical protein
MFSPFGIEEKRARQRLARPQAWHAGGVCTSHEQGKAMQASQKDKHHSVTDGPKDHAPIAVMVQTVHRLLAHSTELGRLR